MFNHSIKVCIIFIYIAIILCISFHVINIGSIILKRTNTQYDKINTLY